MADFGIGETIALSAALGAGSAAMKNQDPLRGALIGGVLGGATAGIGGAFGGGGASAVEEAIAPSIQSMEAANIANPELTNSLLNQGITNSSFNNAVTQAEDAAGYFGSTNGVANQVGTPQGIDQLSTNVPKYDPYEIDQATSRTAANALNQTPNAPAKGFFEQSDKTWLGDKPLSPFMKMAAPAVATTFTPMFNQGTGTKYGVPPPQHYTGPLTKFHYDPSTYKPDVVTPPNPPYQPSYAGYAGYAEGGIASLDKNFAAGGMYPMSQIDHTQYATSPQTPMSMQATMAGYDPQTNPLTGEETTHMASGGIAGLLKGQGDGMSDSIHATIADRQPARLADGEFVIPADVVSHLGNGSTDAGAKQLYNMMDKVRKARTGSKKQGRQIAAGGYLPA